VAVKREMRLMAACGRAAIVAVALLAGPGMTKAATPDAPQVGQAELVVSEVRGRLGETTRELAIKDNVFSEEVIETEADAATRIVFLDGTELSMGPSSRMVLDRYVYDPNAGVGEMALQVVTGVFEFASGAIPSSGYDIRTPFGTLAVRGTRCLMVLVAGEKLVLKCKPEDEVAIAGLTLTGLNNCGVIPMPGTGDPVPLSPGECEQQIEPATAMLASLGVADVAPGAGPQGGGVPQGPGAGDAGAGVSPQ
jgi:FecR protein